LLLLFFLAKTEKTFSNSSLYKVAIYPKLGKTDYACIYMRATSATHPSVLGEVEWYKTICFFLEQLQEFAKFYLANLVFCRLVKRYAK
jgi:hypothetical protein